MEEISATYNLNFSIYIYLRPVILLRIRYDYLSYLKNTAWDLEKIKVNVSFLLCWTLISLH